MHPLTVSEIWIYPVKSLGGIRVSSARVLPKGLEHDRRWMLIDAENRFMTQRVYPQLALFRLSGQEGNFQVSYGERSIDLFYTDQGMPVSAVIWDDTVEVYELSADHNNWFSEILGIPCKLVCFPENNARPVDPRYALQAEEVSLADGYPLLLIGQASLDDLNLRLEQPVPMDRFRPNIVFTGGAPYEEDGWKQFRIGQNRLRGVKPCSRCVLTTIDQATGEKGTEPLATLAGYRRRNGKVYFGQNLLPLDHGMVEEGAAIVLE